MIEEEKKPVFEFGGPCPPIKSWFFPTDPSAKPHEINPSQEQGEEENDTAQPS